MKEEVLYKACRACHRPVLYDNYGSGCLRDCPRACPHCGARDLNDPDDPRDVPTLDWDITLNLPVLLSSGVLIVLWEEPVQKL